MKFSVLLITKNHESFIRRILVALTCQEADEKEILVMDTGSTDKTLAVARSFEGVRIEANLESIPVNDIYSLAVSKAKSESIVFIAPYCLPLNDKWLERLGVCLQHLNVGVIFGRQEPLPGTEHSLKKRLLETFPESRDSLSKQPPFSLENTLIRRNILEKIPFTEENTRGNFKIWSEEVLQRGYGIWYEPHASVYNIQKSNLKTFEAKSTAAH